MMDQTLYLNSLYDCYGELLTDKQKRFFEAYYFDNLTLQEIADSLSVSKNAVHKSLMGIEKKLVYYEKKLGFVGKVKKIKEVVKDEKVLNEILDIL